MLKSLLKEKVSVLQKIKTEIQYKKDILEFFKEVNDPLPLKLIRLYAKTSTSLSGKSIKALLSK